MTAANLGRVLLAMNRYVIARVIARDQYMGKENTELMWALAHMLQVGAEECLTIAEEDR